MKAVDIIIHKRDHKVLSREEIHFFVKGITSGEIPDYQISAWAMAVLLNGMTDEETTDLTLAMAHSGEVLDLSSAVALAVDKHSTGGVGDKTTLVVEPIVAACVCRWERCPVVGWALAVVRWIKWNRSVVSAPIYPQMSF